MTLYSYCLRYDDGAAPNPYWGTCTLTICKPAIRRSAQVGDWVVGLGSANSPMGDVSRSVVYAMRITQKMSLKEYDQFCRKSLKNKIPNWRHRDFRRRVGDCIYDYSLGLPPRMREGVHGPGNRQRDLSGKFALLSTHFYYFGDHPIPLPDSLASIAHRTQGHKSVANDAFFDPFVHWIEGSGYEPDLLVGEPQLKPQLILEQDIRGKCSPHDPEEDE